MRSSRNVAWSPDGRFLSYVAGEGELTLLEVDTGRLIVLDDGSDGLVRSGSGWSPDGQHVAYNKISGDERIPGPLFIAALDGSHWPLPEVTGSGKYLAWSPDGSRIAYGGAASPGTNVTSGPRGAALLVANVDGSNSRHLTEYAGLSPAYFDPWSPGGRLLAYWKNEHGGTALVGDICVTDLFTTSETCLREFTSDEFPQWSPDPGQYIFHNYRIDPVSGAYSEVFERPGVLLSWSPDSNKVAYVEGAPFSEGPRSLVILDLANYHATRLHTTNARTGHTPPYAGEWRPDSRYFAFTAEPDQQGAFLNVADMTSGSVMPVLGTFGSARVFASYSPDGSRLLIQDGTYGSPSVWIANSDGSAASKMVDGFAIFGQRGLEPVAAWRPAPD